MKTIRITLGTVLAIVAINAFGGGYYGMAGAKDVPLEWLEGSPFSSYFIPALFLFTVLGGTCLIASISVFRNSPRARQYSLYAAILMFAWILVQVSVIGYVSWLQPAIFSAGILVLLLRQSLPAGNKPEQYHSAG